MYYIVLLFLLTVTSTLITIIETSILSISSVKVNRKPTLKYLKSVFPKLSFFLGLIDLAIQQLSNYILIQKICEINIITVSLIYTGVSIYMDMLGKSIAIMFPEYFCDLFGYIIFLIYYVCSPISNLLFLIVEFSLKIFGINKSAVRESINSHKEEIKSILQQINKMDRVNSEIQMIETIFELKETNVSTIIVPRNEFCKIQYNADFSSCVKQLLENAHYRFVVVEKDDEIIGYIDFYQLLKCTFTKTITGSIDEYIKEPIFILESSNIFKVIQDIKSSGNDIYFVINEYGTVLGLLTMSDLFDELIGAHYNEDLHVTKTQNGIVIEGIQNIRVLNKYLNWDLPEQFLTISGLLINKVRRIPKEKEQIHINNIIFKVLNCSHNKVLTVLAFPGQMCQLN